MTKIVRHCPTCFETTGDTYEFDVSPPVGASCEDCGAAILLDERVDYPKLHADWHDRQEPAS